MARNWNEVMTIRYIAIRDGSVIDIIEPLQKYRSSLLRTARLEAGPAGHVLVGNPANPAETFRKIPGLAKRVAP